MARGVRGRAVAGLGGSDHCAAATPSATSSSLGRPELLGWGDLGLVSRHGALWAKSNGAVSQVRSVRSHQRPGGGHQVVGHRSCRLQLSFGFLAKTVSGHTSLPRVPMSQQWVSHNWISFRCNTIGSPNFEKFASHTSRARVSRRARRHNFRRQPFRHHGAAILRRRSLGRPVLHQPGAPRPLDHPRHHARRLCRVSF